MSDPELNDLLKLLEKKYQKKPESPSTADSDDGAPPLKGKSLTAAVGGAPTHVAPHSEAPAPAPAAPPPPTPTPPPAVATKPAPPPAAAAPAPTAPATPVTAPAALPRSPAPTPAPVASAPPPPAAVPDQPPASFPTAPTEAATPPGAAAFANPATPPGAAAFANPATPPGAAAFANPATPPGAAAFANPAAPPAGSPQAPAGATPSLPGGIPPAEELPAPTMFGQPRHGSPSLTSLTSVARPQRRGAGPMGGRRPPPPSSSNPFAVSSSGGTPSAFGGGTPSAFGGGTPSAFAGGTPSAFASGTPSAFAPAPAQPSGPPGAGAFAGAAVSTPPSSSSYASATPASASAFGAASTGPTETAVATPAGLRPARPDEPAEAHYGLVVKPIPKPLNTALRTVEPMQIVRAIRPRAGRDVSLWMFRSAYVMGLLQSLGRDHTPWGILAGRKFGRLMDIDSYDRLQKAFEAMKVGILDFRETENDLVFEVMDCMICTGLMAVEEPICSFVGGIIGSVVSRVMDRDAVVRETRCQAMNHPICRFEVEFSRSVSLADLTSQKD